MTNAITLSDIYMVLGFALSLYSCVSNDVIQTLGTFLSSNRDKPAWVIWLFAGSVLIITFVTGWFINDGDMSFGRLARIPFAEHFYWWHVLPPLILIMLTRKGMPVSTTFLILSVFSSSTVISLMLAKSFMGYVLAFSVSLICILSFQGRLRKDFSILRTNMYLNGGMLQSGVLRRFYGLSGLCRMLRIFLCICPAG